MYIFGILLSNSLHRLFRHHHRCRCAEYARNKIQQPHAVESHKRNEGGKGNYREYKRAQQRNRERMPRFFQRGHKTRQCAVDPTYGVTERIKLHRTQRHCVQFVVAVLYKKRQQPPSAREQKHHRQNQQSNPPHFHHHLRRQAKPKQRYRAVGSDDRRAVWVKRVIFENQKIKRTNGRKLRFRFVWQFQFFKDFVEQRTESFKILFVINKMQIVFEIIFQSIAIFCKLLFCTFLLK